MRHPATQASRPRVDRSYVTMQRLLLENARLSGICAQSHELACRYELLLREGDHRIKNSLQVVASLLSLQERRETNTLVRNALHAAASRIHAVARIHDALQLNGGKEIVNLDALIATMCQSLRDMASDPHSIKIVVDAKPTQVPLTIAQPILLAVNELVINALRHAFPDNRRGAILVTLMQESGQLTIVVADDGMGLPADYGAGRGYGMSLVRAMIKKVGGALEVGNLAGARFALSVPISLSAVAQHPSRRGGYALAGSVCEQTR